MHIGPKMYTFLLRFAPKSLCTSFTAYAHDSSKTLQGKRHYTETKVTTKYFSKSPRAGNGGWGGLIKIWMVNLVICFVLRIYSEGFS